jgi:hypothetical protein
VAAHWLLHEALNGRGHNTPGAQADRDRLRAGDSDSAPGREHAGASGMMINSAESVACNGSRRRPTSSSGNDLKT